MLVLHANWMDGELRLWGESLETYVSAPRRRSAQSATLHDFALQAHELRAQLLEARILPDGFTIAAADQPPVLRLQMPCDSSGPRPSQRLARFDEIRSASNEVVALAESNGESTMVDTAVDLQEDCWLGEFDVESLALPNDRALEALLRLENRKWTGVIEFSDSVRYWIAVARFVIDLLADQRFIPTLLQRGGNGLTAAWQPWLHDEQTRKQVGALLKAMPPIVRAVIDRNQGQPWSILNEALRTFTDASVRAALRQENFIQAIEDRDPKTDPHVAWLAGLLDFTDSVNPSSEMGLFLLRDASQWVSGLEDTGQDRPMHLCLKLNEPSPPIGFLQSERENLDAGQSPVIADQPGKTKGEDIWQLSLHLQSADDRDLVIDASQIWAHTSLAGSLGSRRVDHPEELLLSELGRASRIYPKIESVLSEKAPTAIALTTAEAHEFLREVRPLLEESGFGVIVPSWWNQPLGRLAARLHIDAPPVEEMTGSSSGTAVAAKMLGLNSLVKYRWQIAIGDQPLSMQEFQALTKQTAPLVQVHGKWIEISPQHLAEAREFLEKTPAGEMTLLEAIQIANGADSHQLGLPVYGMDASGWVADVLGASSEDHRMPQLEQPRGFVGALRPYQKMGLSWLAFLDRFGLGACLADDMGLGKTIQLIAMLLHEREQSDGSQVAVGPTLLIVPTSVVSNWVRELGRFAPTLKAYVHHGPDRPLGDRFVEIAAENDLIITTYPLISRDHETLRRMTWHRVALDEAQYIKNPPTKQTMAIRSLQTGRRLALTGTPVENRLSELWSIMEFCNPGYLGSAGEFRRRFAVPVERHRDQRQADRLRHMVRPFVLRRVKSDPTVIDDLPECLETKEYATLTPEQAALYQKVIDTMLSDVDRAQGMQRRGLVLATLVKLKQICNHPASWANPKDELQAASDQALAGASPDLSSLVARPSSLSLRSGKAKRLITLLEEVLATGERALIFTQFRQMGHLLTAMIQSDLDREALFLHGGTPAPKRQQLIDRFQAEDGGVPIFVLSLKAGGLGLNLTAANHVFHYDRWWNPAVENQATDRAFRIGQTRTVHVHKFVCVGTLEERIDQMIEQKTELAQNIIGSGEQWLTELSTSQLHELLMLRPSATEIDQ